MKFSKLILAVVLCCAQVAGAIERIPQSAAIRVPLKAYLTSDHISDATSKASLVVKLSQNGGAFANPSAGATNATEIANGWYYVDLTTTDTGTTGPLIVRATQSGVDNVEIVYDVTSATPDVNVKTWLGGTIPSPSVTGVPKVDLVDVLGTAPTASTSGILDVNTKNMGNSVIGASNASGGFRTLVYSGTVGATVSSTTVGLPGLSTSIDPLNMSILVYGTGPIQVRTVTAWNSSTSVATVSPAFSTTPTASTTLYNLSADRVPVIDASGYVTANSVTGAVASVTADVGITQAGADKAWSTATRVLTAGTNIALAKGTGLTGLNDIAATAIVSNGAITTSSGAVSSVTTAVNLTTNNDKTGYTLTVTPPTAAANATAVWDTVLASHVGAGSTGAALNGISAGTDPWGIAAGSYGAGTFGYEFASMYGKLNTGPVLFQSPNIATGRIEIQAGDAYLATDGRAPFWLIKNWTGPAISGLTVKMSMVGRNVGSTPVVFTGSAVASGSDCAVTVELAAAQTVLLTQAVYGFQVKLISGVDVITTTSGIASVTPNIPTQ